MLLAAGSALAQTTPLPAEDPHPTARSARSVGGHAYSEFENIELPFVATRVTSRTGIGVSQFELRGERVPRRDLEGDLAQLDQRFVLGIALTEWLGLEVGVHGGAIGGIDYDAGLVIGANGFGGGRLSGVVRVVETDAFLLSLRVDVTAGAAAGIAPARTVIPLLTGQRPPESRLRSPDFSGSRGTLGGSVTGVLTATEWLGFAGSFRAEARRVEFDDVEDDEGWLGGALGASFNFGSLGVPLQILLGSRVSWSFADEIDDLALSIVEPADEVVVEPELGFYYFDPKLPELEVGLSTSFAFSDETRRGRVGLNLAYWF
ncbi:hypothetical protein [Sandaracinus amylolyticus]|uniref:Uncharacterized protein n=1 Tax=Sandaracinus amylolyticus TaxID=927083 RepID=A0A0F6YJ99_9BACT|nr:hypothetical protein [Sandaracinus amylolyticus]AKF06760.1 hypothetical protein DB32_003909 [Sandaracinus amylolyticus]